MQTMSASATAAAFGKAAYERYWGNPMTVQRHVDELERLFSRYLLQRTALRCTIV
jgi:hypothetical protein